MIYVTCRLCGGPIEQKDAVWTPHEGVENGYHPYHRNTSDCRVRIWNARREEKMEENREPTFEEMRIRELEKQLTRMSDELELECKLKMEALRQAEIEADRAARAGERMKVMEKQIGGGRPIGLSDLSAHYERREKAFARSEVDLRRENKDLTERLELARQILKQIWYGVDLNGHQEILDKLEAYVKKDGVI